MSSRSGTGPTSPCRRRPSCWQRAPPGRELRLSSREHPQPDDPIRVFQQFHGRPASGGRPRSWLGAARSSSRPLFGYDLADYDRLFEASAAARRAGSRRQRRVPFPQQPLRYGSRRRGPIRGAGRQARVADGDRDHRRRPDRPGPAELTARPRGAGLRPGSIPISINSHGFIAETSQAAADPRGRPSVSDDEIGRGELSGAAAGLDAGRAPGALFVGSPAEVTRRSSTSTRSSTTTASCSAERRDVHLSFAERPSRRHGGRARCEQLTPAAVS